MGRMNPNVPTAYEGSTPPPPKKTNWVLFAALGCFGLMLMIGAVFAIGSYFVYNKVKDVVDTKNPTAMVAKIIEMSNPDAEVVKVDSDTGSVTIKDKKTGKVITMNLDDVKKGKITFEGPDGEKAEFGTAKLPDWIPAYPGATVTTGMTGSGKQGSGGMVSMSADGKAEDILKWYEDKFTAAGMSVESKTLIPGSQGGVMVMKDAKKNLVVTVGGESGGKTTVGIQYSFEK